MEDRSNAGPPSKRQRTVTVANDTLGSSRVNSTASRPQNEGGVLAAVNKLTKLVEYIPNWKRCWKSCTIN